MKELVREVRRHAHDDRLLDLSGGLQSTIARLDALLAQHAPPGADDADASTATVPGLVDALLGVIAIRNRLASAFEGTPIVTAIAPDEGTAARSPRAPAATAIAPDESTAARSPRVESLLR